MSGFRQPITQEQAELMKELTGYNLALNPNTARLLQMGRTEGWSSTAVPVKKGGTSPAAIDKAIARNAGGVSLSPVDKKAVKKGDDVSLVGFGTFTKVKRAARTGVNPATGEKIKIKAKTLPKFRPGKAWKEMF